MSKIKINVSIQDTCTGDMHFSTEVKVEKFDEYIKEEEEYGDVDNYSASQLETVDSQDIKHLPKIIKIASMLKERQESNKIIDTCKNIKSDVENSSVKSRNKKAIKSKCKIQKSTQANIDANQNNVEDAMKKSIEDIEEEIKQETLEYEELLTTIYQSRCVGSVSNQNVTEPPVIKMEPADEEIFENDLIQLDYIYPDAAAPTQDCEELTDEGSSDLSVDDLHVTSDGFVNENISTPNPNQKRKTPKLYECKKCGHKSHHRQYREHIQTDCMFRRRGSSSRKDDPHKCTKCGVEYNSMNRYLLHLRNHGYQLSTCPCCMVTLTSMFKLQLHLNKHVRQNFVRLRLIDHNILKTSKSKKGYECKLCKECVNRDSFFAHWETHLEIKDVKQEVVSDDNDEIQMDGGNTEALHPDLLKKALKFLQRADHLVRSQNCAICRRNFRRKNECKRHTIEHLLVDACAARQAAGAAVLRCQICRQEFRKADRYKWHMRDHGGLPIYRCELCDHTFSDSSNFAKHKKIHNLQVLCCDICDKKFLAKSSLVKHIEMHNNTEPLNCQYCPGLVFYTQSSLNKHIRVSHIRNTAPIKCGLCNMKFASCKEKWDHMWYVHKERKDIADCPVCQKSFRKFQDVKTHMMTEHNLQAKLFGLKGFRNGRGQSSRQARKQTPETVAGGHPKEELAIAHSTKEEGAKPHSIKDPSVKDVKKAPASKRRPVKKSFTKYYAIKDKSVKGQMVLQSGEGYSLTNTDLSNVQLPHRYSVLPVANPQPTVKVINGKSIVQLVNGQPSVDQPVHKTQDSTKEQPITSHSTNEQGLAVNEHGRTLKEQIKVLKVKDPSKVRFLSRQLVRPNSRVKLKQPLLRARKWLEPHLVTEEVLKETSIKPQLIKSESGQFKWIVFNRIRK